MSTNITFVLPASAKELTLIEDIAMEQQVIGTLVATYDEDGVATVSIEYAASFLENVEVEDRIEHLYLAADALYMDTYDESDFLGDEDEDEEGWSEEDYA